MRKVCGLIFVLAVAATPAMAQKVTIDFAHDYDFSSVKTFRYVDTTDSNIQGNQMMADRVATMILKELREGGLVRVQENPDIFVTYHYTTEKRSSYTTTNYGYGGYHGGWRGWGGSMGTSTTQEQTYTDGTLIVDAYDATDKQMIWRGTGTVTVKAKPEKQTQQVQNILNKLGKKWDKILAGKGK